MNVFYLDDDPSLAATYHCDRHAVKMIVESAQLCSTAIRVKGGTPTKITFPDGKIKIVYLLPEETWEIITTVELIPNTSEDDFSGEEFIEVETYELILSSNLYIQTHINHCCNVWIRENYANWSYVFRLMIALEREWRYRYEHNRNHKSVSQMIIADASKLAYEYIDKSTIQTPPALAMPEQFKVSSNPVECYREYYRKDKVHLHQWTRRRQPEWL